jgi:TPR repeat protein
MYDKGKGVKQDDFKALKLRLLEKLECFEIILFNAIAFFIHKSKIIATTDKIQCDLNFSGGCSQLGLMYEKGKGVKQDDFKALKFYHKSKIIATTAKIQITRLLVKLERL